MNGEKIKNIFKLTTLLLVIISMIGCSSSPKIVVYDTKMNDSNEKKINVRNENGDTFSYVKNTKGEIIQIVKHSNFYPLEECNKKSKEDFKNVSKIALEANKDKEIINAFPTTLVTEDFFVSLNTCLKSANLIEKSSNIKEELQPIYSYTITIFNSKKTSESQSILLRMGKNLGNIIILPFLIVGAIITIIVSPFYLLSKSWDKIKLNLFSK